MATSIQTFRFERPSRGEAPTARQPQRIDYGFALYAFLHILGFLTVTLLMTWGVFVLFFLAIGGFSVDGMMHHLANLSSRYITADTGRLGEFKLITGCVHMLITAAIVFFRRHAMFPNAMPMQEHAS